MIDELQITNNQQQVANLQIAPLFCPTLYHRHNPVDF